MDYTEKILLDNYTEMTFGMHHISMVDGQRITWDYRKGRDEDGFNPTVPFRRDAAEITLAPWHDAAIELDETCNDHPAIQKMEDDYRSLMGIGRQQNGSVPEPDKPKEKDTVPFYTKDYEFAAEHQELDTYRASIRENRKCVEAVEQFFKEAFDGAHLKVTQPQWNELTSAYGEDRVTFVLANTIYQASVWDGRYSRQNVEWARSKFDFDNITARLEDFRLNTHPVVVNGMADTLRKWEAQAAQMEHENPSEQKQESPAETAGRTVNSIRPKR